MTIHNGSGELAIQVEGLVKRFGEQTAVDHIDLAVPAGSVFGLLGPNGAGKTTIVRMLATLLRPDGGTARVAGLDVVSHGQAVRRVIGLTGQFAAVDESLSGYENIYMIGRLLDLPAKQAKARALELLETFGDQVIREHDPDPVHSTDKYRATAVPKYGKFSEPLPDIEWPTVLPVTAVV